MNFRTEGLLPPAPTSETGIDNIGPDITEADYQQRKAAVARCLADSRAKWIENTPQREPDNIIAFPEQSDMQTVVSTDHSHIAG